MRISLPPLSEECYSEFFGLYRTMSQNIGEYRLDAPNANSSFYSQRIKDLRSRSKCYFATFLFFLPFCAIQRGAASFEAIFEGSQSLT
jgi:hypothetical protein